MQIIKEGDILKVEDFRGPELKVVTGPALIDDEGYMRVEGVPVWRDANGYFPRGIVVVSIRNA